MMKIDKDSSNHIQYFVIKMKPHCFIYNYIFIIYKQRMDKPIYQTIRQKMISQGKRFVGRSNISEYVSYQQKEQLKQQLALAFENVLKILLIDQETEPNGKKTASILSDTLFRQLSGRFDQRPLGPKIVSQVYYQPHCDPIEGRMTVMKVQVETLCRYHLQRATGTVFIALVNLPYRFVQLGSFIKEMVQWCSKRIILQEELAKDIVTEVSNSTGSQNVAVLLRINHGCCDKSGKLISQSTVLKGAFKHDQSIRQQFFDSIMLQDNSKLQ